MRFNKCLPGSLATILAAIPIWVMVLAQPALACDAGELTEEKAAIGHPSKPMYSPFANRYFPAWPLLSDTYVRTAISMNAGVSAARLNAPGCACASGRG